LPAYKVEAILRVENIDRWDDRLTLRTNLIDTYLELKRFIDKHLPDRFYMEGDHRIDLRDKIFREVIGNMIVHREYMSAYSSDMIITKSAVTLKNPNKPLFHGLIDPASFNPYPKNPNIRKFFTAFGWTDEIGSGIRNTNKYLPLYVPGAKPMFWEDNIFKTEIPLITFSFGNVAETLIEVLDFKNKVDTARLTVFKKASISPTYTDFINDTDKLLIKMGCTWYEKGVKFDKLRFLINNNIQIEHLKKESTLPQKGVKLFKKRGQNILKTLVLLLLPMSLDNLVEILGFNSKNSYRDDYIKPLKDNGLIVLTIPDNPNDPEQKYVISEKGKMFLGGMGN
jgi:ATP-dependent DNA helicase RecG